MYVHTYIYIIHTFTYQRRPVAHLNKWRHTSGCVEPYYWGKLTSKAQAKAHCNTLQQTCKKDSRTNCNRPEKRKQRSIVTNCNTLQQTPKAQAKTQCNKLQQAWIAQAKTHGNKPRKRKQRPNCRLQTGKRPLRRFQWLPAWRAVPCSLQPSLPPVCVSVCVCVVCLYLRVCACLSLSLPMTRVSRHYLHAVATNKTIICVAVCCRLL